jgi:hypothetical protein
VKDNKSKESIESLESKKADEGSSSLYPATTAVGRLNPFLWTKID